MPSHTHWTKKVEYVNKYHAEFVRLVRRGVVTQQTKNNSSSNSDQAGPQEEPQEHSSSRQLCLAISKGLAAAGKKNISDRTVRQHLYALHAALEHKKNRTACPLPEKLTDAVEKGKKLLKGHEKAAAGSWSGNLRSTQHPGARASAATDTQAEVAGDQAESLAEPSCATGGGATHAPIAAPHASPSRDIHSTPPSTAACSSDSQLPHAPATHSGGSPQAYDTPRLNPSQEPSADGTISAEQCSPSPPTHCPHSNSQVPPRTGAPSATLYSSNPDVLPAANVSAATGPPPTPSHSQSASPTHQHDQQQQDGGDAAPSTSTRSTDTSTDSAEQELLQRLAGDHLLRVTCNVDRRDHDSCTLSLVDSSFGPLQRSYIVLDPLGGRQCQVCSTDVLYHDPQRVSEIKAGLEDQLTDSRPAAGQLPSGIIYRVTQVQGVGGQGLVVSVSAVRLLLDEQGVLCEEDVGPADAVVKLFSPTDDPVEQEVQLQEAGLSMMPLSDFVVQALSVGVAWVSCGSGLLPLLAIVVPRADGGTLKERLTQLRRSRRRPDRSLLAELMCYMYCVVRGLEDLHSHKVVHRDVKPGNVGLFRGGPKLLDLGLARILPDAPSPFAASHSGYQGSVPRTAPELDKEFYVRMLEQTVEVFEEEITSRDPGYRAAPSKPHSTTGSSQAPTGIVDTLRTLYGPQADLEMMQKRLDDARRGLEFFREKKQQYLDKADSYTVAMLLVQVFDLADMPFSMLAGGPTGLDKVALQNCLWQMNTAVGPEVLLLSWHFEADPAGGRVFDKLLAACPEIREPLREVVQACLAPPWSRKAVSKILDMKLFEMFGGLVAASLGECDALQLQERGALLRDWGSRFPQQALALCSQPLAARQLQRLPEARVGAPHAQHINTVRVTARLVVAAVTRAVAQGHDVHAAAQAVMACRP